MLRFIVFAILYHPAMQRASIIISIGWALGFFRTVSDPIDVDNEGNPLTLMDVIAMDDTVSDEIDLKIRVEQLYEFLGAMKESREKEILVLRYGLYGNDYHTQRQVAKRLGISRSYVSRIEKKALLALQKVLKG